MPSSPEGAVVQGQWIIINYPVHFVSLFWPYLVSSTLQRRRYASQSLTKACVSPNFKVDKEVLESLQDTFYPLD